MTATLKTTIIQEPSSATANITLGTTGNVGIGTASPTATLDVTSTTSGFINLSTTSAGGFVGTSFRADALGNRAIYRKSRSATVLTNTIVQNNDEIGLIGFRGADGTSYIDAAAIAASVDGTPGTNDMPGRLTFLTTADGSSTLTERMRINSSGNVGIGASNPTKKLSIGNDRAGGGDALYSVTLNTFNGASFENSTLIGFDGSVASMGNFQNFPFMFFTNNTERLRIDTSGNVLVTGSGGLGYGTGSGGTVTQATDKTTAVTLNKTNGFITMNASALAANTATGFTLTNSTISNTDVIIVNVNSGVTNPINYNVWGKCNAGSASIYLKNISVGSLSEAVVLSFAVIKSATS